MLNSGIELAPTKTGRGLKKCPPVESQTDPNVDANKDHRCADYAHRSRRLTMRLSDAGLRQRRTKAVYPDHRLPPRLSEDAARDRSNRLLGDV